MSNPTPLISLIDDRLVINKMRIRFTEGELDHLGNLNVAGRLSVNNDVNITQNLNVKGEIEVDTLRVKNLVTDIAKQTDAFTFESTDINQLNNKGLLWHEPRMTHQLVFKSEPQSIFSSENLNLHRDKKYQIEGIDVLEKNRLGSSVLHSNLRTVGRLENLSVSGNVDLGETLFLSNSLGRVGLNTDSPNAALSIVDNLVEIVIGSDKNNRGFIGTWANHSLDIVTDNTKRISINGNIVEFGSAKAKNATVKIHGTLEVDSIVSETRIEKTSPIEFLSTDANGIYGKGMAWKGVDAAKQFFLQPDPDRFFSSEHVDLSNGKHLSIGGIPVIKSGELCESIVKSNLTSLGELTELTVKGNVNLDDCISIENRIITFKNNVDVKNGSGLLTIKGDGLSVENTKFSITADDTVEFSLDTTGNINLGNKENTNRTINAYGRLSINITNPDPSAAFSVNGTMIINGKKFSQGESEPDTGAWSKGDIVWNTNPQETNYIGWVCVLTGTPGVWKPFGYIG